MSGTYRESMNVGVTTWKKYAAMAIAGVLGGAFLQVVLEARASVVVALAALASIACLYLAIWAYLKRGRPLWFVECSPDVVQWMDGSRSYEVRCSETIRIEVGTVRCDEGSLCGIEFFVKGGKKWQLHRIPEDVQRRVAVYLAAAWDVEIVDHVSWGVARPAPA